MIEIAERILFLKKIHLFRDLRDNELSGVAERLIELTFKATESIFEEGDEADGLFMVFKGRTLATHTRNNKKIPLAIFVRSDYFGEEGAYTGRKRSASMEADEDALLFQITRTDFNWLLKKVPKIAPNFKVSIRSRRLARNTRLKWLNDDEVVYFITRKHPLLLAQAMVGPIFTFILVLAFIIWAFIVNSIIAITAGAIAITAVLGWAIWNFIDWGNDYYIVTNQRVIWLEKVIGLYDSRQEAPLGTVLSISVESNQIGRILDYGSVIIRTFVGQIKFDHVNHPDQAARMIEEHWDRIKAGAFRNEKDKLIDAIRGKMGLTTQNKPKEKYSGTFTHPQKEPISKIVLKNLFRLKVEEGSTVTYRKHWYVLWLQAWKPTFFLGILLILMIRRGWEMFQSLEKGLITRSETGVSLDSIFFGLPVLMIPLIIWLVYQYMDWSNDIFQVSADQIVDIDRKPFGAEERRSAQIDNILGTEYKRIGLAAYFLNFGTVYITVGGMQLAFEDVMDPAAVQSDIDRRRATKLAKKKETEASGERERMATWLAIYHQTRNQIFNEEEEKRVAEGKMGKTQQPKRNDTTDIQAAQTSATTENYPPPIPDKDDHDNDQESG